MNAHQAKLERKEARRVLGDRTTSIVGSVREELGKTRDRVQALEARADAGDALEAEIVETLGAQGAAFTSRLDGLEKRLDHGMTIDREARSALSDRLNSFTDAGFLARLRWLLRGRA
jgi:hypothetical protein